MEELKDDYREGESFAQYAIDTILLPFRIATSPLLLRTYLRTILLFLASTILFCTAVIAYSSFYYSYIPIRGIRAPIYLQFHHSALPISSSTITTKPTVLQAQDVQSRNWPYGIANIPGLVSRQKYDVVVEMTVPRSTSNLHAGNWMIGLEMRGPETIASGLKGMLGWDEEWDVQDHSQGEIPGSTTQHVESESLARRPTVLARSRRPAILTYRSWVLEHVHRLVRMPLYLIGWHTESEHIEVSMMEGVEFERGGGNVPTSIKVELRAKYPLEVYTVAVRLSAKMEGLRWVMYRYWISSAVVGITLFWSVEMGVLLCTWGVFTFLFGSASSSQGRDGIKTEDEDGMVKREPKDEDEDPGTPYSDTSRTFPTLSTHQPLHYASASPTSPKQERTTPALEDIPTRDPEDAEDDEEDDDFILEEPLPRSAERDGIFTDSGIGTSVESAVERERGLNRRKSGRRDER